MLLFFVYISMMTREMTAYCKSVFFNSLLFVFFLFVTIKCYINLLYLLLSY